MKRRRRERIRTAIERMRAKVSKGDYDDIRRERFVKGLWISDIVKEYPQYSRETVRRILGRGRGYVLVVGMGKVASLPPKDG